jgi:hypothetical protein
MDKKRLRPRFIIVANTLRGKAVTDLLAKVKDGGTFASVTGEPDGAKDYPKVRVASPSSPMPRRPRSRKAVSVRCFSSREVSPSFLSVFVLSI